MHRSRSQAALASARAAARVARQAASAVLFEYNARIANSTDAVEGVAAMMENRKPAFRGEQAAKHIGRRFIADTGIRKVPVEDVGVTRRSEVVAIAEGYHRDPEPVPDGELRCGNLRSRGGRCKSSARTLTATTFATAKLTVRRRRGNTGSPAGSATCR